MLTDKMRKVMGDLFGKLEAFQDIVLQNFYIIFSLNCQKYQNMKKNLKKHRIF